VIGYFFNPNIHPYTEYIKRLKVVDQYAKISIMELVVDGGYELEEFLKGAMHLGHNRCLFCYRFRLEKAFKKGLEMGVTSVTTTLLYSRYQRHDEIKSIGDELSKQYGIEFMYRDFRHGWKEGIEVSKALNMYRQNYCGCIFSEKERYFEKVKSGGDTS